MLLAILSILNIICLIVVLLLEARRKEKRAQLDGGILDYSLTMRLISIMGLFTCAFLDYVTLNGSQDKFIRHYSLIEAIIIFTFCQLIIPFSACFLFFESFFTNIKYSPTGITIYSIWKGTRSVEWNNIQMVTFASSLKGNRIYFIAITGKQFRIEADYFGFDSFVYYVKEHLLPSALANSEGALELAREYSLSNRGNTV